MRPPVWLQPPGRIPPRTAKPPRLEPLDECKTSRSSWELEDLKCLGGDHRALRPHVTGLDGDV